MIGSECDEYEVPGLGVDIGDEDSECIVYCELTNMPSIASINLNLLSSGNLLNFLAISFAYKSQSSSSIGIDRDSFLLTVALKVDKASFITVPASESSVGCFR